MEWLIGVMDGDLVDPDSGDDEDPIPGEENDPHDPFQAEGIATAGYFNAGQDCTAATRVLASPRVYNDLVEALAEQARTVGMSFGKVTMHERIPWVPEYAE